MKLRAFCFIVSLLSVAIASAEPKSIKVFILAGQSNMEGKAKMSLVEYQAQQPATKELFAAWRKDEKWIERPDVWIKFWDRHGPLTVGYGSPNCIGPELAFGQVVGDHFDEQVLLLKTAWGGRSLYRDFRPPSAGLPPEDVLQTMLKKAQEKKPETTLEQIKEPFGASYRAMIAEVKAVTGDLSQHFPAAGEQKVELAGLVWFQGWNDMIDGPATAEYAENLVHFIQDIRRDLATPKLPVVVGQMGVDGLKASDGVKRFKDAQARGAMAAEFAGNVVLVKTDVLWDQEADAVFRKGWKENLAEWNTVGSDFPYHYLGSAKCHLRMGKAFGEAMILLQKQP